MLTKAQIEELRKLAESHNFGGLPIPQLCDLAILGATTRDLWFAEYFQQSAHVRGEAWRDFEIAKRKWLDEASKEDRETLAAIGRRFMGLA